MAKLTYLELTNRVLKRITQAEISDTATATGQALIITELINEAQNELWTETNWYSLYKTRVFNTIVYESDSIAFVEGGASADTITDSDNAFVTSGLSSGMQILISGTDDNDGVYTATTVAAGTITLPTTDDLTAESAGTDFTITAITYPVASTWGRTIDLMNVTDNRILIEDVMRAFDQTDPDADNTGTISHFALQGAYYRFYPIPAGAVQIRERYYAVPTTLTVKTETSDLPIECENAIIQFALAGILDYLNKFEHADKARVKFAWHLNRAIISNKKMINRARRMGGGSDYIDGIHGIRDPKFPSNYDRWAR